MKKGFFCVLVCFLLLLCGCETESKTVVGIRIPDGTFDTMIPLDSEIDVNGKNLVLVYSDKSTKYLPISVDMVVGFTSRTTGQKQMYIRSGKYSSDPITYTVYDPSDASRAIETEMRLTVSAEAENGDMVYTVRLKGEDIEKVYALSCTWEGSDAIDGVKIDMENGTCTYETVSSKKIRILAYSTTEEGFSAFRFTMRVKGNDRDIQVKKITISDGERDYDLPDVG